jgi:hypothetical protein
MVSVVKLKVINQGTRGFSAMTRIFIDDVEATDVRGISLYSDGGALVARITRYVHDLELDVEPAEVIEANDPALPTGLTVEVHV